MADRLRVVVIDYGLGNTCSVMNAVLRLGYQVALSNRPAQIAQADALILPGVGAFQQGMRNLELSGLRGILEKEVLEGEKPLLGICLGMQMLAEASEENGCSSGLGWVPGRVVKLSSERRLPVPHVGWNLVNPHRDVSLFSRLAQPSCFYFDHSYHFDGPEESVCASTDYGGSVVAAIHHKNILGVQFHPEKSQNAGLKLLRGFFSGVAHG